MRYVFEELSGCVVDVDISSLIVFLHAEYYKNNREILYQTTMNREIFYQTTMKENLVGDPHFQKINEQ